MDRARSGLLAESKRHAIRRDDEGSCLAFEHAVDGSHSARKRSEIYAPNDNGSPRFQREEESSSRFLGKEDRAGGMLTTEGKGWEKSNFRVGLEFAVSV